MVDSTKDERDFGAHVDNYKASHKTGISLDEVVQAYSEWANSYDEQLCPGKYNGPAITANAMANHFCGEMRLTIKILDVAAGTGQVGHELFKKGFRLIDALEPSDGMLKVLESRGIYGKIFKTPIGFHPVSDISSNSYDAVVISGGMGVGHIPVQALNEMIRVVIPDGIIVITMREEYLINVPEYVDKLEPYMRCLELEGAWEQLSREVVPGYFFDKNGVVFKYRVIAVQK